MRAEPCSRLYTQGKVHHTDQFDDLENQMVTWEGGSSDDSPDRVDALVWALTELMLGEGGTPGSSSNHYGRGPSKARQQRRRLVRNR